MKRKKIIIFGAVVLILVTVFFAVGVWFFLSSFYRRFETPAGAAFDVSEFDSLSRERHTFTSDKGQELTGYLYQNEEIPKKGLLIFAHGYGGGGHERYMALLNASAGTTRIFGRAQLGRLQRHPCACGLPRSGGDCYRSLRR